MRAPWRARSRGHFKKGDLMFIKLLLTAMLATTLAFAQRGGGMGGDDTGGTGGGRGGGMGDDAGGMPRAQRQTPFDIFADRLKLNKDQKAEAQTVLADAMKESAPLRQQLAQGGDREREIGRQERGRSEEDHGRLYLRDRPGDRH